MIQRRAFLQWSCFIALSSWLNAKEYSTIEKEFKELKPILRAVHSHMFPLNSKLPSAEQMRTVSFLEQTLMHSSFDRDIRRFIIKGAKRLHKRERGFVTYSHTQKEKALRAYEQTRFGKNWLNRMMTMGLEAMFSDPIYGSNIEQKGWRAIKSYGGYPRAKTRYLEDV